MDKCNSTQIGSKQAIFFGFMDSQLHHFPNLGKKSESWL